MTAAIAEIVSERKDNSPLTWEEIAQASGLSVITVKRIAGRGGKTRKPTPPDIEQLAALAPVFGLTAADWIADAERRVQGRDPQN